LLKILNQNKQQFLTSQKTTKSNSFTKIRTILSKIKNFIWVLGVNEGGDSLYKTRPKEMPTKWPSTPASLTRLKRCSSQANQPRPNLDYQNSTVN